MVSVRQSNADERLEIVRGHPRVGLAGDWCERISGSGVACPTAILDRHDGLPLDHFSGAVDGLGRSGFLLTAVLALEKTQAFRLAGLAGDMPRNPFG
jgi:hypothetical protein